MNIQMNELHGINMHDTMFLGKNTTFEKNLVCIRVSKSCGNKLQLMQFLIFASLCPIFSSMRWSFEGHDDFLNIFF